MSNPSRLAKLRAAFAAARAAFRNMPAPAEPQKLDLGPALAAAREAQVKARTVLASIDSQVASLQSIMDGRR